jgi:hypothetical protein
MVRGSGRGGHQQPRRPVDLTGFLSTAEKNDLFTLINAITEKLHNDITSIFESSPVTPTTCENGHHHWLLMPLLRPRDGISHAAHLMKEIRKTNEPTSYEKAHDIIDKEEKQSMSPQLGELKKEAEAYFRKWQTLLLQRVRDIVVNDIPDAQGGHRGRGRGVRGAVRGRGGRGGGQSRGGLTLATGKILDFYANAG